MEHYSKHLSRDLAEALTEIIMVEAETEQGVDFNQCTPPPKCKTYTDTLTKHGDKWIIYYNDQVGNTLCASITIPEEMQNG